MGKLLLVLIALVLSNSVNASERLTLICTVSYEHKGVFGANSKDKTGNTTIQIDIQNVGVPDNYPALKKFSKVKEVTGMGNAVNFTFYVPTENNIVEEENFSSSNKTTPTEFKFDYFKRRIVDNESFFQSITLLIDRRTGLVKGHRTFGVTATSGLMITFNGNCKKFESTQRLF